ncbi:helix-turn-helix transcriptional regulator [Nonomuraea turcica]|uniref:helix-turn-helix transcriptional regulator n=1 Tax=Nonomuraea sp. G32 TaxID=3067274 RepID=UPI00273AAA30|nr:LuxR family transcriptional regulator [Nonomuraea sp. G32]MDP4510095.1 AAA family ATPase [Nonomuraea sp. G32]
MILVGRDRELAQIADALSPEISESLLCAVLGDPGIGKSSVLTAVTKRAAEQGVRVLRARGSTAETDLPFAGLHQLLFPVLDRAESLPNRRRSALLGALGLGEEDVPPDGLVLGMAVLTLLSRLADDGPVLLAVDDLQWIDLASRSLLAFLARRLEGEPIGLIVTARGDRLPAELDGVLPVIRLEPLPEQGARLLLDSGPNPPTGAVRELILAEAEGNPLALVELAKAMQGRELAQYAAVPVTELLERTFAAQVPQLPASAQAALLVAAAADTTDLATVQSALPDDSDHEVWLPAEQAGLIRIGPGLIEFRHPLVRSAIYGRASFSERRRAHLALAAGLDWDPDRRAWHLSTATAAPDETIAATVEAAADRAVRRGATAEALAGFVRAGQLSPGPREHGRRLGTAAVLAFVAGAISRAEELAQRASELTDDPATRVWTGTLAGIAGSFTLRLDSAFRRVMANTPDPSEDGGMRLFTVAAHIAFTSGKAEYREQVIRAARVDRTGPLTGFHLSVLAMTDPFGSGSVVREALPGIVAALDDDLAVQHMVGTLAARVDEPTTAIDLLEPIGGPERPDAALVQGGLVTADLGWAYLDAGRWTHALACVDRLASGEHTTLSSLGALVLDATLAALRGDIHRAWLRADLALSIAGPAQITALLVRTHWVTGMVAVADGDPETAYRHFRRCFDAHGEPLHYVTSCYQIGDLAAAAARTGRASQTRDLLSRVRELAGTEASARLQQIMNRAEALLAPPGETEERFIAALADPAGERWPFERAQIQLDHGEWLRRARRASEARAPLSRALKVFEELGAVPWAERTRAELRATGIAPKAASPDRLAGLPPRTQQIVQLAAQGLTNKEIGDRLFLSHRTVGSHLYQAFPKLGISTRAQLRDLLTKPQDGATNQPH